MLVTYVYAVVGWKLILRDFEYGFGDSPDFAQA